MGETIQADIERKGSMGRRRNGSSNGRGEVHPLPPTNSTTGTMYGRPGIPDTVKLLPPPGLMPTRRRRSCPWLVPIFVVINVVMFIITMYINNCPQISTGVTCVAGFLGRFSFQPMSENPLLGPSSSTLVKMGALDTSKVSNGQGWRLFSCMWLHAGVFHLLVNMLSLLFIGMRMEREFGSLRIAIVYLLSGFGGSLLSALFIQNTISVGASGALFGLLGAMLSELITNWTIYENKVATLISLLVVIALNLVVGMLPHVDNFAHIGGFLSGFLLGFVFLMRPQFGWINQSKIPPGYEADPIVSSKHNAYQWILWIIAFAILIVGFIVAVAMVFRGYDANKHCSWCHYLDCIPSSKWSCDDSVSCQYTVDNSTLTMTCIGTNATSSFTGITNPSTSEVTQFCIQACS